MAEYSYNDIMKMQNDAIRRAEDMQRRARQSAGLEREKQEVQQNSRAKKEEPRRVQMPNDYLENLKHYGSNSSRTRTLVIGIEKKYQDIISPIELFPNYCEDKKLKEVIGSLPKLEWGEFDNNDFYHQFRIYPEHMRKWIHNLKEGQSAFDNKNIEEIPHKVVDGEIIINQNKNGDKYTRQIWDKVAPCIHTRNDLLASQSTVHPEQDRVFSIRELMKMMTIPDDFKWIDKDINELNSFTYTEKLKVLKSEEVNIRQSIGEAVPTNVFYQIASKIKESFSKKTLNIKDVKKVRPNFNVWCYSGYTIEELENRNDEKTNEALKQIDVLVDGRFVEAKKDPTLKFRGSSNQRILDVQKCINESKIVQMAI